MNTKIIVLLLVAVLAAMLATGEAKKDCRCTEPVKYCDSDLPRLIYDESDNKCKMFHNGGCEGEDEGHFESLQECAKICQHDD